MTFSDFGLVNTQEMFRHAMARGYAVGAFNFYNMETLGAIFAAAHDTNSPIILAVSESALDYMGDNILMGMIAGLELSQRDSVALHLDHGHSFNVCARAIDLGFSSVMIDASQMPFQDNIAISARVSEYAHKHNVSVEAELGVLAGFEDKNTNSDTELFTNPDDAKEFVACTNVDSLAVAVGTSHGAYKRKSDSVELRFDILHEIEKRLPQTPLVLHGASSIPQTLVTEINANGGDLSGAHGIPATQLRRAATTTNICKINVDSDSRLAFTAAIRRELNAHPTAFNPREYLTAAMQSVYDNTVDEIRNIMMSNEMSVSGQR